jgi:tRNA-modifying protein YgfZ
VGVDIFFPADSRDAVRAALDFPDGDEALAEIVRVESGRPRFGIDIEEGVIPQEAGLNERAVSFTKGCYVGQETVARLYYRGKPNRRLRGVRLSAPTPAGAELRLGEKTVGKLGSSVVSPVHGPIGLALVRREAEDGATVDIDGAPALIVDIPFAR